MPSTREIDALQAVLEDLTRNSAADLGSFWRAIEDSSVVEVESALVSGYPELVTPYIAAAGEVSTVWYADLDPDSDFSPTPADLPPVEQLQASARWSMGPMFGRGQGNVLDLLTGSAQRAVYNGSRDTVVSNATREGRRWARHASANACAFCRMLATRGAAYGSRDSALRAHDHCHCLAVPVRDTYEPPEYVADWEREYNSARREAGSSTTKILAVMRRHDT